LTFDPGEIEITANKPIYLLVILKGFKTITNGHLLKFDMMVATKLNHTEWGVCPRIMWNRKSC